MDHILFVDDVRTLTTDQECERIVTYARNRTQYQQLFPLVEQYLFSDIYLDHDMGFDPNWGEHDIRPFVTWLVRWANSSWANSIEDQDRDDFERRKPRMHIITANPVGAQWMMDMLGQDFEVIREEMKHPHGAYVGPV